MNGIVSLMIEHSSLKVSESVLADLYEEEFKRPAPDVPLGDLFGQVKDKIDFPVEVASAIDTANKAELPQSTGADLQCQTEKR